MKTIIRSISKSNETLCNLTTQFLLNYIDYTTHLNTYDTNLEIHLSYPSVIKFMDEKIPNWKYSYIVSSPHEFSNQLLEFAYTSLDMYTVFLNKNSMR